MLTSEGCRLARGIAVVVGSCPARRLAPRGSRCLATADRLGSAAAR
jgi:hypothetical protein